MKLSLGTPITKLRMVGPAYAARLKKLEIETIRDLLYHKPHRYIDYSLITPIMRAQSGETVTVQGAVVESKNVYTKTGKVIQKVKLQDRSGQLEATWFNQPFIPKTIKVGESLNLSGEIEATGLRKQLVSPEYEIVKEEKYTIHTGRLVPVYPETEGLSSKWLRSRIAPLIKIILPDLEEWLPDSIREKERLLHIEEALANLHFPESPTSAEKAKKRLAFDEMFLLQVRTLLRKKAWQKRDVAHKITVEPRKLNDFQKNLPFKLTDAQKRVTEELLEDLSKDRPMNRLLLGDVGCGKTVVAAIGMYASHTKSFPSVLMAPTEILAHQHEKTITGLLKPFNVKIGLCTASRKVNLSDYDLIIGTHALLYKTIEPQDFGLAVIDEQQRFGVEQRGRLIKKGKTPHILTMTATPIPRTVALTLYGDLDLSIIDEMPPGRMKVKTWIVPPKKREGAYQWIRERIKNGEQAFIVCPLIETSEHESMLQVKAATEESIRLSKEIFPDLSLGLLHGRMKAKEKEEAIQKFRDHKTEILVATPVVEVGIDIPGATIMMIEGAERFGLAQLHQLRGRVGRGDKQSFCLLFTSLPKAEGFSRLKALEMEKSGNELAELDLKLRGPGDIYGTRQHGFADLKFASWKDAALIAATRRHAHSIVEKDPKLKKHQKIKAKLGAIEKPIEPN
ncbi:ATP-dependent DNA helicase RecG [Patescibacteria group bacterium]|nr:ATP-dependent DNA helicase RecG [Patescibacteria group bacterium]